jgi:hypothetical protein
MDSGRHLGHQRDAAAIIVYLVPGPRFHRDGPWSNRRLCCLLAVDLNSYDIGYDKSIGL